MREYIYTTDEEGNKIADLDTVKLTLTEAWGDFHCDAHFDYIPVGAALEKYSVLVEVLMFLWEQNKIGEDEVRATLSEADRLMQIKLDKSKNGKLTRLPQ